MQNEKQSNVRFALCAAAEQRKERKYPVYARIVVNKTRVELSTKQYVNKSDWDEVKGRAKPRKEDLKQFNSYLEELRGKIAAHYRELKLSDY